MQYSKMIAKAWLDKKLHAALRSQGVDVPPRPDDLTDEQIERVAYQGEEYRFPSNRP